MTQNILSSVKERHDWYNFPCSMYRISQELVSVTDNIDKFELRINIKVHCSTFISIFLA